MGTLGTLGTNLKKWLNNAVFSVPSLLPLAKRVGTEVLMDRKQYLELSMRYATVRREVTVKPSRAPDELIVYFEGNKYLPNGYQLTFDSKGKAIHTAILHDAESHSVVYCQLSAVTNDNTTNCD